MPMRVTPADEPAPNLSGPATVPPLQGLMSYLEHKAQPMIALDLDDAIPAGNTAYPRGATRAPLQARILEIRAS